MIGVEARLTATLNPGLTNQQTTNYGAVNQVTYFSVDGTPVVPRRTVVAMQNCNSCHVYLEEHGDLRNNVTYCVICHNPENTDFTTRPSSTTPALANAPPQAINFALMVHKIHTGVNLANFNAYVCDRRPRRIHQQHGHGYVPAHGTHRRRARHRAMLHVPRQQL